MRRIPKKIQDEDERLLPFVLEKVTNSNKDEKATRKDVLEAAIEEVIEKYGSPERKAFHAYCKRIGDEHQLCEKDGRNMLDKNGDMIQTWNNSEDGFVRDRYGNKIYYKDGTPVPNVELPEIIRRLYDEESTLDGEDE